MKEEDKTEPLSFTERIINIIGLCAMIAGILFFYAGKGTECFLCFMIGFSIVARDWVEKNTQMVPFKKNLTNIKSISHDKRGNIYALCEDSTIWKKRDDGWIMITGEQD